MVNYIGQGAWINLRLCVFGRLSLSKIFMEWLRPLYWKTLCLWRWGSGRICSHNARGDSFANTNIAINFFLCMSFRLWGPSHHTLARQAGVSRARCQKSRGLDDVLFRTKKKETLLHWSQSLFFVIALKGVWRVCGGRSLQLYIWVPQNHGISC